MTAAAPSLHRTFGVQKKKAADVLKTPTGFSKGVLGHHPWRMQAEILESVATHRRTAVKSCNASGKTFTAADAVLWWVTTYPDGIAVTTAPTWTQVKKLLWGEIRKSAAGAKVKYPKPSETELMLAEGNYAIGLSTNESTRFQGFHAGKVLIVLDEAPGVRNEIWEAIQGLRAGGDISMLAIGNPVDIGGEFHSAFTSSRDLWNTFTISAFDTPNLAACYLEFTDTQNNKVVVGSGRNLLEMPEDELDRNPRPYLCTRRYVKEMFTEWGPNHAFFQSRVLGEFPTESDDTLIPLAWLERLKTVELPPLDKDDRPRAGIDVAGPGEAETVLVVMRGPRVLLLKAWPNADPRGEIVAALAPYKDDLESVNVDSIGVGWGLYLHLCDIFGKERVHAVNVGAPARVAKKFVNSKAEYFWNLRLMAQAGDLLGLTDDKTIGQLTTIKYSHNARGHIEIESKDELRKRGVKSPDRAEALMLANARVKRTDLFAPLEVLRSDGSGDASLGSYSDSGGFGSSIGERWGGDGPDQHGY